MKRCLLVATLIACGGSDRPAEQPAPVPSTTTVASARPAPQAPTACLSSDATKGELLRLEVKSGHAFICYAEGEDTAKGTCADVDLASGNFVRTEKWKPQDETTRSAPSAIVVTTTSDSAKVCKANDCTTVKLKSKKAAAQKEIVAEANADGTRLFVLAPELAPGANPDLTTSWTTYGDTYDTKSGRRLFHQRLTTAPSPIFSDLSNSWSAKFVGKNLVLGDYVCCGPGGTTMLFDPEQGTIKRLHDYAGSYVNVGGSVHAVLDEKKLTFVDFDTLQNVGAPIVAPGKPFDSPERSSARVASDGGKIVLAFANPAGAWILDGTTRTRTADVHLPSCL